LEQKLREGNKMVKKTLFAIALALLVTTANAGIKTTNFEGINDDAAVKVEGSEKWEKTFNWDYWVDWGYHTKDICTIPVKMEVGMYIEIIECHKKEILLKQVSCGDLEKLPRIRRIIRATADALRSKPWRTLTPSSAYREKRLGLSSVMMTGELTLSVVIQ
jgi:hypothetical protein